MANLKRAADQFAQLSDPTRLRIMTLLALKTACNVGEICTALDGASQPAVSHHLALMRHAWIVECVRSGKHVSYSLTADGLRMVEVVQAILR